MPQEYDAIIIGAGMSGLAAGIRLAMFDKSVLILEKHRIAGGLNSYYARKGRKFDVGLHALTNFAPKGERGKPLTKLLKQLRIPYDEFALGEQSFSQIRFPQMSLNFTNNFDDFKRDVFQKFPAEEPGFEKLLSLILDFDEVNLNNPYQSAKALVREYIADAELVEMLFCPLMIYGSAWEDDMDFSQFVIMFKSIFLEGFSRPEGGVRRILTLLTDRYKKLSGEVRYKAGVAEILSNDQGAYGVTLESGEIILAKKIFSTAGLPETQTLSQGVVNKESIGKLSFTETILFLKQKPVDFKAKETICFYNSAQKYRYQQPKTLFDSQSAVVCFPNNFANYDQDEEGVARITFMANYDQWSALDTNQYAMEKEKVLAASIKLIKELYPDFEEEVIFSDVFTPLTIQKFTGHFKGTVYGNTQKSRDGKTAISGLYICGTDQGFLGIVGAMLSGISIANLYGLMESD